MRSKTRLLALAAGLCVPAAAFAQPATEGDLGAIALATPVSFNTGGTAPGQVKWWTFTLSAPIRYQDLRFLDIRTTGSVEEDPEVAVYSSTGVLIAADDDDDTGFESQLTFGTGNGEQPSGGNVRNGRDGDLPAGTYYLAVSRWGVVYNATNWGFTADPSGFAGDAVDLTISADDVVEASPPVFSDLGDLSSGGSATQSDALAAGQVLWYRVVAPAVSNAAGAYLDMDTEGTALTPSNDTRIALYGPVGAALSTGGTFPAAYTDLTDGSGSLSQMTFGLTAPARPAVGNGLTYNGRDGALRSGVYYIAVASPTTGAPSLLTAVGVNFGMTSSSLNAGTAQINVNVGLPTTSPSGTGTATPSVGGVGVNTVVRVTVTPGANPVSTGLAVSLNAGAVDGGTVALLDNGVAPDATAGDNIFSGTVTVGASALVGPQVMTATISDAQSRSGAANVAFTVVGPPPACPTGDETHTFTALDSEGGDGAGTNTVVTFNSTGAYNVGTVRLSGRFIANNIFGADARIRVTSPGGESFDFAPIATDPPTGIPTDVEVELSSGCVSPAAGTWTVRVYEDINDTAVPDGVWANLCVALVAGTPSGDPTEWRGDLCVGDAGDLPGTAQSPVGAGTLSAIKGRVSNIFDADMYVIKIKDPANFSATTTLGDGTMVDTTLYLFNLDGTGIGKNDDVSDLDFLSTMPAGDPAYATLVPGDYLLAVSGFMFVPVWVFPPSTFADAVFDPDIFEGVIGPQAGAGPIVGWGDGGVYDDGTYTITLTGASYPGGGGGCNPGCNIADITESGGTLEEPGCPDGQLTLDDILVFIDAYNDATGCPGSAPCNLADITESGGTIEEPGSPDGQLTLDDILVFVDGYNEGC